MSEWLERELAHHLAPVEAPAALEWRDPAPKKRQRSFTLAPILAVAAAAAVMVLAVAPERLSVAEANRYLRERAGIGLAVPATSHVKIERVRLIGRNEAAVTYRTSGGEATVLIARSSAARRQGWTAHGSYAIAGGCVLCHANL